MQVLFYILPTYDDQAYDDFIFKMVHKVYQQKHRLLIYASKPVCRHLDLLLWQEGKTVYLPHIFVSQYDDMARTLPVLLSDQLEILHQWRKVLIMLADSPPEPLPDCHRLIEITDQNPERLLRARKHYRLYQQSGFTIKTHQL